MKKLLIAMAALAGATTLASPASATEYIYGFSGFSPWTLSINGTDITSTDTGWINSLGEHNTGNPNYIIGDLGAFYNNYGVFNLSSLGSLGTITSLKLTLNSATSFLPNGPRSYSLYNVLASATALDQTRGAGDATGIALYNDLGNGAVYGVQGFTAFAPPTNSTLTITLNAAAITNAQSQLGHGNFAIGGSLNLPGQAAIGAVPEPAAWALMLAGFGLVGGAMRRRQTSVRVTYA